MRLSAVRINLFIPGGLCKSGSAADQRVAVRYTGRAQAELVM